MKTSAVINALLIFVTVLFVYFGYGYYIDRTMEKACGDSEIFLTELSHTTLSPLLAEFETPPKKLTQNYLAPKITEIRKIQEVSDSITLSELEIMYAVLGDYLEPESCDFFTNVARASQARTILLYTEEFRNAETTGLESEITDLADKSNRIDHISAKASCGLDIDNPILEKQEKEYCEAIHEQNYRLVKELEMQIAENDPLSQIYKATLANCLADCLNEEVDCVDDCWKNKLS